MPPPTARTPLHTLLGHSPTSLSLHAFLRSLAPSDSESESPTSSVSQPSPFPVDPLGSADVSLNAQCNYLTYRLPSLALELVFEGDPPLQLDPTTTTRQELAQASKDGLIRLKSITVFNHGVDESYARAPRDRRGFSPDTPLPPYRGYPILLPSPREAPSGGDLFPLSHDTELTNFIEAMGSPRRRLGGMKTHEVDWKVEVDGDREGDPRAVEVVVEFPTVGDLAYVRDGRHGWIKVDVYIPVEDDEGEGPWPAE
ncbi:hypothetical protein JCM11251_003909 [Rhodosporidiobolus azoricus]